MQGKSSRIAGDKIEGRASNPGVNSEGEEEEQEEDKPENADSER